MFRAILYLIVAVLVLSVVRSILGVIVKAFSELTQPAQSAGGPQRRPPAAPSGGELKKDPICGTFIAASTALQRKVGGETYYFCSAECRDKFKPV
jgi:YHS domain-containing protein